MDNRNILLLGINDDHDARSALVLDDKIIHISHEERSNNIKSVIGIH